MNDLFLAAVSIAIFRDDDKRGHLFRSENDTEYRIKKAQIQKQVRERKNKKNQYRDGEKQILSISSQKISLTRIVYNGIILTRKDFYIYNEKGMLMLP